MVLYILELHPPYLSQSHVLMFQRSAIGPCAIQVFPQRAFSVAAPGSRAVPHPCIRWSLQHLLLTFQTFTKRGVQN
jgi:hypothetical protein